MKGVEDAQMIISWNTLVYVIGTCESPIAWAEDFAVNLEKGALMRVASEITEDPFEVVVAGWTSLSNQACRKLKILFHILQLAEAAA